MHFCIMLITLIFFSFQSYADLSPTVTEFSKDLDDKMGNISSLTQQDCIDIAQQINGEHFRLKNFGPNSKKTRDHTDIIMKALAVLSAATYNKDIQKKQILDTLLLPVENSSENLTKEQIRVHRAILGFLVQIVSRHENPLYERHLTIKYLNISKAENDEIIDKIFHKYSKKLFDQLDSINEKSRDSSPVNLMRAYQYSQGVGVEIDLSKAKKIWAAETKKKNTQAMMVLGETSEREGDSKRAQELYTQAANLNNSEAMIHLARLEKSSELAQEWLKKAAELNNPNAMFLLAETYIKRYGKDNPQNLTTAKDWYYKAAQLGHTAAMIAVAKLSEMDAPKQALRWYEKVASTEKALGFDEKDRRFAILKVAKMYELGIGTDKNLEEALNWYEKAAEWEDRDSIIKVSSSFCFSCKKFKKNPKKAFELVKKAALLEDAQSMYILGSMYLMGLGTDKNATDAFKWFKAASERGNTDAMDNLGTLYKVGVGIEKNNAKAQALFEQAANKGNPLGMLNLASMYEHGEGVEKNLGEAIKWYQKAAELGDTTAMTILAQRYLEGMGVKQNPTEGLKLYEKAASLGNTDAMVFLGLKFRMIEKNNIQAKNFFEQAANNGHPQGMLYLALLYEQGVGIKKDMPKAIEWYKRAVKRENTEAMVRLGRLYQEGMGVKKNNIQAKKLFKQAAIKGHPLGMIYFTFMYGEENEKDISKAIDQYKKSASSGNPFAMVRLGRLYLEGIGVEKNDTQAQKLFEQAANKGHPLGMLYLASLYEQGVGIKKDMPKAIEWLKKASELVDIAAVIAELQAFEKEKMKEPPPAEEVPKTKVEVDFKEPPKITVEVDLKKEPKVTKEEIDLFKDPTS